MSKSATCLATIKAAGNKIYGTSGQVQESGPNKWYVYSQTLFAMAYVVVLNTKGLICDCPQCEFGRGLCKHVVAVDLWLTKQWESLYKKSTINICRPAVQCHHCGSLHVVRDGVRYTKRKGPIQKYLCKRCDRRFSGLPKLKKYHTIPEVISDALSLVSKGMSLKDVTDEMSRKGYRYHRSTIHRWTVACCPLMNKYVVKFRPNTGYKWNCDEICFRMLGGNSYLFAVMDNSSRFILSHMISPVKFGVKPLNMFREAAYRAGASPRVFITDGLHDFCKPVKKAFGCSAGRRLVHVREIHIRNEFNHNNIQESFNGTIKPLISKRGGCKTSNPVIMQMAILAHNFFRSHMGLNGKTPAEMSGIFIEGNDKILTLLEAAAA